MSLAVNESEGEQIELRTLQSQLEKTQDLVGNLTQQLIELKEQVSAQGLLHDAKDSLLRARFHRR